MKKARKGDGGGISRLKVRTRALYQGLAIPALLFHDFKHLGFPVYQPG